MSRNYRGGAALARPENALKRAEELIAVGQKPAALQALHDVVTSKKYRTWQKTYESIMFKLIDLCVEMKKRNHAKEALMQYRNMCQQVNINSLEEVIKYYLNKATEKAEEARQKSEATALDAVEDLEEDAKPEDLMLSYVSGEKSKDRTDRELVTPWFRFLWESYRSVLEILRSNPKLEALYTMTAVRAFNFCLTYKRNSEFRRLCDILRQHLNNMNKYREQRDITQPESLNLHLETRFEQLKVACELEMWAEAFRSVEDIQHLIALGKRQPKQQMMATYYSRLTQIFAVSESHLYHAYAWLKLFNFSRTYNKNLTPRDQQMMATSVVLATMSILPYDRALFGRQDEQQVEQEKERTIRMANILGFTVDKRMDVKSILTRGALLSSINSLGLLGQVPPEVKAAFDLLTGELNPLELCKKLAPLLEAIQGISAPMSAASPVKDLAMNQYVAALKQVAVVRALKQLSEVYSTMRITELAALVPFAGFNDIESVVVDAVKYDYLQVRIDHRNGTLHFGAQQLESDKVRNHLALLAKRLAKAASMMDPTPAGQLEAKRRVAIDHARKHMETEHVRLVARKTVIEKRKEQQEQMQLEQEREEAQKKAQLAREQEILEEKRRREEAARREKERLERELEEAEMQEARAMLEATKKKKGVLLKDGEKFDKKAIMQEALSERLKEQQELERKLARIAKNMDHLERARREEEVPFLEAAGASRAEEDRAMYEATQAELSTRHAEAWKVDIEEKHRLHRMLGDRDTFSAAIISRRAEEFEELRRMKERRAAERRAHRKVEREIRRRQEFVQRCQAAVEEKVKEMEVAAAAAAESRRKAELEEKKRKFEEELAKQREREAEIERKIKEDKDRLLGRAPAAAPSSGAGSSSAAAASSSGGGGNRFVPPSMRAKMAQEGGGGSSSGAPAAAAAAADSGDRWGRREAPAPVPAREREPPSVGAGSSSSSSAAAAPPRSGGGAFVPPHLRNRAAAAEAPPPAAGGAPPRREDGPPRRDDAPAPGRGGGYKPPAQREGGSRW